MLIAVTFVMHAVFLGERCIARHLFQIWKNMIFIFFFHFRSLYHIARVLVKPILQPQVCSPHFKGLDFFFFYCFFSPRFSNGESSFEMVYLSQQIKETWHMHYGLSGSTLCEQKEKSETKVQTKVPPSPAFSQSCRDLPMRDIFSSEHWLLGRSCLDETTDGGGCC